MGGSTPAKTTDNQATFSLRLFNTIAKEKNIQNLIISPASVQTILALTYMGTDGEAADELRRGLNLGKSTITKADVASRFRNLLNKMRGEDGSRATLKMANRIYVQQGNEIQTDFNAVAERYFDSGAEIVNFVDNVNTAQKINNWVEEHTENKIQNIISPDSLDGDTAIVLINAIYLNATWLNPFNKESTAKKDYHLSKTRTKKVDMMYKEANDFGYAELSDLDAKALAMGYLDTNIRMLVLLPNRLDGLGRLREQLRDVDLTKLLNKLGGEALNLSFPKFKIEFDISLQSTLETLGMRKIFSSTDAFRSLLSTNAPVTVSKVLHKAFIEVDEIGTVAAGSTYVQHVKTSNVKNRYDLNVDHPFFFALLDNDTVYFTGHITDI